MKTSSWKVNQPWGWVRPLTETWRKPWRSTRPLSALVLVAVFTLVACFPPFPASPYFTDLHGCRSRSNEAHYFLEPVTVDGFYTVEIWQLGIVPTVNEAAAVEVLGGDPQRLHFIAPSVPAQIVWKARGGDNWQPASRQETEMPSNICLFV